MTRTRQRTRPTRQETRERILDGATEAFAERGFHGASQDEICARVGLTRGAFTSSFKTKDELFLALYDRMMTNLRRSLSQAVETATSKGIADITQFFRYFVEHYPIEKKWYLLLTEFTLYSIRNPEAAQHLAKRRSDLLSFLGKTAAGFLRAQGLELSFDHQSFARLILAMHEGNMSQSFVEPDAVKPGSLFAEFGPMIFKAASMPIKP